MKELTYAASWADLLQAGDLETGESPTKGKDDVLQAICLESI